MADVEFHDFSIKVFGAINDKVDAALEECAAEIETQTKRNSRVKTGQTKNSFTHKVDNKTHTAYIGSDYENAIWEEFGTGEYALNGDGRKGGWVYYDENGKRHFTTGKKPSRAFYKAFTSCKNKVITRMQDALKGL